MTMIKIICKLQEIFLQLIDRQVIKEYEEVDADKPGQEPD